MARVVLAQDGGYGLWKYVTEVRGGQVKCAHFPSLAPVASGRDLAAALGRRRKTVEICVDGVRYEVGPDAGLAADLYHTRNMDNDYVLSAEYLALARGALHYAGHAVIDLLVVGLPVSTFLLRRAQLERRLTGVHHVGGGRQVRVRRVRALAQPQGALMHHALSHKKFAEIRQQRNLILDAGARTFDWLVAEGLKPIEARSGGVSRGMHDVLRVFAEGIGQARQTEFSDFERIDRALREGHPPMVFQEAYDLAPHLAEARKIAEGAVTAMKRVVQDGNDIDNIILAGGAMFFYRPVIQAAFPRHKLHAVKNALYANVIGFQWAGMESARQEAAEVGDEQAADDTAA